MFQFLQNFQMTPLNIGIIILLMFILGFILYRVYKYFTKEDEMFAFNDNEAVFRMIYVDWCGYCKITKPDFEKLGKIFTTSKGKNIVIESINGETQKDLVEKLNVDIGGYPTLLLTTSDGITKKYNGERTFEAFKEYLNANV
jgi:thiol-disulfide isomerase/thioredoxin